MNNYHFYEEIGKGKHSMVYRCRKKKCVEFCAIKSVDKVSRQKVLNEVMVLNSLHHHNVLKFHTWCAASLLPPSPPPPLSPARPPCLAVSAIAPPRVAPVAHSARTRG